MHSKMTKSSTLPHPGRPHPTLLPTFTAALLDPGAASSDGSGGERIARLTDSRDPSVSAAAAGALGRLLVLPVRVQKT